MPHFCRENEEVRFSECIVLLCMFIQAESDSFSLSLSLSLSLSHTHTHTHTHTLSLSPPLSFSLSLSLSLSLFLTLPVLLRFRYKMRSEYFYTIKCYCLFHLGNYDTILHLMVKLQFRKFRKVYAEPLHRHYSHIHFDAEW